MIQIPGRHRELMESDIVRLYKMFCATYNIPVTSDHVSELGVQARQFIASGGILEYSPQMDARLFIEANGSGTNVWIRSEDRKADVEFENYFKELYTQFFTKNDS